MNASNKSGRDSTAFSNMRLLDNYHGIFVSWPRDLANLGSLSSSLFGGLVQSHALCSASTMANMRDPASRNAYLNRIQTAHMSRNCRRCKPPDQNQKRAVAYFIVRVRINSVQACKIPDLNEKFKTKYLLSISDFRILNVKEKSAEKWKIKAELAGFVLRNGLSPQAFIRSSSG